jgi:hypothetical protein
MFSFDQRGTLYFSRSSLVSIFYSFPNIPLLKLSFLQLRLSSFILFFARCLQLVWLAFLFIVFYKLFELPFPSFFEAWYHLAL